MSLIDVQALTDTRGVSIDTVGVEGLRYPVLVCDGQGNKRDTEGNHAHEACAARSAQWSRFSSPLHESETIGGLCERRRHRRRSHSVIRHRPVSAYQHVRCKR